LATSVIAGSLADLTTYFPHLVVVSVQLAAGTLYRWRSFRRVAATGARAASRQLDCER
jgi:hypothetical protein